MLGRGFLRDQLQREPDQVSGVPTASESCGLGRCCRPVKSGPGLGRMWIRKSCMCDRPGGGKHG